MRELLRFFWNSTRGHRLAPWRSPYLRWRMETYSGLKWRRSVLWRLQQIKERSHACEVVVTTTA
jgi:hypothetical protein